ncbi:MAG: cytochrome P450 [Cellulophaga sp.]|nr:cytochrome P450 [Cellulophaga sp.]
MKNLYTVKRLEVIKNSKRILKNPLPFHNEKFKEHGHTFKVQTGWKQDIVFTQNPGFIKHILQKQHKAYQKSTLQTKDLAKYIGNGILTSNGEHWRTHRRMVQPAFHKKKLANLMTTVRDAILSEIKGIPDNTTVDVYGLMGNLAFQVVAQSLFSSENIREEMNRLQFITETNQRMLIKEMRQPYLNWWFKFSGKIDKHLKLSEEAQEILSTLINTRRNSNLEKDDLLDMLLQARYEDGTPMPQKQLIDEVLILFTAGHETTANVLSFLLYLLAKHPEVQEKAYQEATYGALADDDILPNLAKLPYIQNCIEEAMRLFPPAYVIDRVAIQDDTFENMNIPKDTMILMSIYELHRCEEFWENPATFYPDRFNEIDKKLYQDYYYPFGAGPRMCVGNNFAMYEMIITVAEILKKYQITTEISEVEINPLISLKPKEVPLKFTLRK